MKRSELFTIELHDLVKGFITAVITSLIASLYVVFTEGFPTSEEWLTILGTAICAGLAYLAKNFCTTSKGEFMGKEPKKLT